MLRRILVPVAALLLLHSPARAATVVDSCGQTVLDGVLAADLDCSGASGFAVTVEHRGSLDLAGHTLIGTSSGSTDYQSAVFGGGIHCLGECTIQGGGGEIVGPPGSPVANWYSIGVYSDWEQSRSRVHLSDATVRGWSAYGVASRDADVRDCDFNGNLYGLVVVKDLAMSNCTANDNTQEGAHVFRARIFDSNFDRNMVGLYVLKSAKIVGSSASDNDYAGIYGLRVVLEQSDVLGNCKIGAWPECTDLLVRRRPHLELSNCTTSSNDMTDEDWNVCSAD